MGGGGGMPLTIFFFLFLQMLKFATEAEKFVDYIFNSFTLIDKYQAETFSMIGTT